MIAWFIQWRLVIAVLAVLSLIGGVYLKGRIDGNNVCGAKAANAITEGVKEHAKLEKKVIALDDVNLRKRFCQWVRNDRNACLQANIPISEGQANTGDDAANRDP